jgi:hypothetical protein
MTTIRFLLVVLATAWVAGPASANDIKGSRDHPMISRYP